MNFSLGLSPEWTFECFLDKIVCDITDSKFLNLKHKLEGSCPLIDNCLKDANTANQFFENLKNRGLLTRYNIDLLYHILYVLDSEDLLIQLMTYRANFGKELTFQHILNDTPETGFEYITVSIPEENVGSFDMAFLNDLKAKFSSLLMVPSIVSFIVGVEPEIDESSESSLKVIFMIPEMQAKVFKRWMDEKTCDELLQNLQIKRIRIKDQTFSIQDKIDKVSEEESRLKVIADLYEDLKERAKDLNRAEELIQEQIDQLGKIRCLPDRLLKLHTKSGMSVTLWKTLVKTFNGKLASHYIPEQNHIDIEKQSLHCKITRVYPQIKEITFQSNNEIVKKK